MAMRWRWSRPGIGDSEVERIFEDYLNAVASRGQSQIDLAKAVAERDYYLEQVLQIKIALERVAVLEGQVEGSALPFLVNEVVRDHEELELRIEAALVRLAGVHKTREAQVLAEEVIVLLRGGSRIPDTVEGLL